MSDNKRVPLFERLPEIYKIRDGEQTPPRQLETYLGLVEDIFGSVHENIESLYHDHFIEFCDAWVVAYLADLLGTSHLAGDPWTLRADVADTIALRRRKGTIGSIERLTFDLTGWGVHCTELRENLGWHQHLNHQRPDAGGKPPYGLQSTGIQTVIRGGTVTLRDPALLSLLYSPFDPFAHWPDLKPANIGNIAYNLPNLAIFLWRLAAYRVEVSKPVSRGALAIAMPQAGEAAFIVRFDVHPMGEPVRLFNVSRYKPDAQPPVVSQLDETPGPIPTPRLTQGSAAGNPAKYLTVETYDATDPTLQTLDISEVGLQLHLPQVPFGGNAWTIRGVNLCAWEAPLRPRLRNREIAIDPVIGRMVLGVMTQAEATALVSALLLTYTYGFAGPVGAHPISRPAPPTTWNNEPFTSTLVNFHQNSNGLRNALNSIQNATQPILIEINDSMTHDLDLAAVAGTMNEAGGPNLRLNRTLIIRATDDNRPVIRLARPLRVRPTNVVGATPAQQAQFDAVMDHLTIRLEGLYLTRGAGFPPGEPLIARAALNSLEVRECTFDPGGFLQLNDTRAPIQRSMLLASSYGFVNAAEATAFKQTPEIKLQRTISGPLLIDSDYELSLTDSIVDGGKGVLDDSTNAFAVSAAADPVNGWGPPCQVNGITAFGRTRVESMNGRGGIWVHRLEVLNNQKGCIKFSYFSGESDRLPQNFACVRAPDAILRFVSESYGQPGYAQLSLNADRRVRERGPEDDAMGAFGFLLESHKWRNLEIRYREFMTVGVRPLLIPVT